MDPKLHSGIIQAVNAANAINSAISNTAEIISATDAINAMGDINSTVESVISQRDIKDEDTQAAIDIINNSVRKNLLDIVEKVCDAIREAGNLSDRGKKRKGIKVLNELIDSYGLILFYSIEMCGVMQFSSCVEEHVEKNYSDINKLLTYATDNTNTGRE